MQKVIRNLRYDWPLHFILRLTDWLPDNIVFLRLRGFLASPFIGKCGRDLRLGRGITFYNPSQIRIGEHVYIAFGCWFMAGAIIEISDQVQFGPYCVIVSSKHIRGDKSYRYGAASSRPIRINAGSWIGAHVTIGLGVTIGRCAAIGANSLVNRDIPADSFCGGVPARVIRTEELDKS